MVTKILKGKAIKTLKGKDSKILTEKVMPTEMVIEIYSKMVKGKLTEMAIETYSMMAIMTLMLKD